MLYGLIGVKDMLVAGPNIVGLALGILQLFLRAVFPAKCVRAPYASHMHVSKARECTTHPQ